jgi:hypothetical protein
VRQNIPALEVWVCPSCSTSHNSVAPHVAEEWARIGCPACRRGNRGVAPAAALQAARVVHMAAAAPAAADWRRLAASHAGTTDPNDPLYGTPWALGRKKDPRVESRLLPAHNKPLGPAGVFLTHAASVRRARRGKVSLMSPRPHLCALQALDLTGGRPASGGTA